MIYAGNNTERRGYRHLAGLAAVVIVLLWSGVCMAQIQNPSFEAAHSVTPWPRTFPSLWGRETNLLGVIDHPLFSSCATSRWMSDGAQALVIYSRANKTFPVGEYQSVFQSGVDLTGKSAIVFDVRLAAVPLGVFGHFEASLLVDGVPLWTQTADGVHRDQRVELPYSAGKRKIEMRVTSIDPGTWKDMAYWVYWDNLRLVDGPTAIPACAELCPSTIHVYSQCEWVTCYIELEEDHSASEIDGATVTLQGVPAHLGQQGWATAEGNAENVRDFDDDGRLERMVRFDHAAIVALVQPPEATLAVEGKLTDGVPFVGAATVVVVDKQGDELNLNLQKAREKNPNAGKKE